MQLEYLIYDIKNFQPLRSKADITSDLVVTAESLISAGAMAIIAGCTEIPLNLKQEHLAVPYFDALTLLARAAIVQSGRQPIAIT